MDVIIFIVVCLVVGFWLAVWFVSYAFADAGKHQKAAESDAPRLLDELFDGSAQVVYEQTIANLKTPTLIKGAVDRGYKLVSQSGENMKTTMVFEKV